MRNGSILVLLLLAASIPAARAETRPNQFRALSLAMSGGFQTWDLAGFESTLEDRADQFALDGYSLGRADFGPTYSYGGELQFRMTELFFLRGQVEWTRLRWEDRDRQGIARLGGTDRTQISYTYQSQVRSRPLLWLVGAGIAQELESVRLGLSGSFVVAPVELRENVTLSVDLGETETEVLSRGTGTGFEVDLSLDAFMEVRTTVFLEGFWRTGSAEVELQSPDFESSTFPLRRRIDFDGFGLRGGFRWI